MSKKTLTPQEAQSLLKGKRRAKADPQGPTSDNDRLKQIEREIKALWKAYTELQIDLNKKEPGRD